MRREKKIEVLRTDKSLITYSNFLYTLKTTECRKKLYKKETRQLVFCALPLQDFTRVIFI